MGDVATSQICKEIRRTAAAYMARMHLLRVGNPYIGCIALAGGQQY